MKAAPSPIHFAGSRLGEHRHVCAFFHNSDEEYRVLLPFIKDGRPRGRSRIVCQMDWAVESGLHVADVIEFESRVNEVWRRHDDAVVCVYDPAKFGGGAVINIMRTHPLVVIGGTLRQNPFFVPPEEFLCELRERRAAQAGPPAV